MQHKNTSCGPEFLLVSVFSNNGEHVRMFKQREGERVKAAACVWRGLDQSQKESTAGSKTTYRHRRPSKMNTTPKTQEFRDLD